MQIITKAKLESGYDAESIILIAADLAERLTEVAEGRSIQSDKPLVLRLELTSFDLDEPRI